MSKKMCKVCMLKTTNTLTTEIKEDLTEGRATPWGLIRRFSMLTLPILPKLIYINSV